MMTWNPGLRLLAVFAPGGVECFSRETYAANVPMKGQQKEGRKNGSQCRGRGSLSFCLLVKPPMHRVWWCDQSRDGVCMEDF